MVSEVVASPTIDAEVMPKFLSKCNLSKWDTPRAINSRGHSILQKKVYESILHKYGVNTQTYH